MNEHGKQEYKKHERGDDSSDADIDVDEVRKKVIHGVKKFWTKLKSGNPESRKSYRENIENDDQSIQELNAQREKVIEFLKHKKDWIVYIVLGIVIWFGAKIRLGNLGLLKDVTNGKYVPLALDPHVFLKYAQYIVEHGFLPAVDPSRFVPVGRPLIDLKFLSYTIAYMYKIASVFSSTVTLDYIGVVYPVVFFVAAMLMFFLLIRRLFDVKVALLATTILSVAPTFLYRTMAGFSDKESLGTFFMFTAMYFYVVGLQSKRGKWILLWGTLSGIFTSFMGLVWGGWKFLLLIIGIFTLVELLLNKIEKKDFYQYTAWVVTVWVIMVVITGRFTTKTLFVSMTSGLSFLVFFILLVDFLLFRLDLLKVSKKISHKLPHSIFSLGASLIVGLFGALIVIGPTYFGNLLTDASNNLLRPLGTNRWMLTVAEQHQPYFVQWGAHFGPAHVGRIPTFFALFYLGSILLFYNLVKPLKARYKLTGLYIFFISAFIFSRYSQNSTFNGINTISVLLYIGSLIVFVGVIGLSYLYSFYKDKDAYNHVAKLDKLNVLLLVWFVIMVVAARGAIRLFFVMAPIGAVLASYFVVSTSKNLYNVAGRISDKLYSRTTYVVLVLFLIIIFSPFGGTIANIPILNKVPIIKYDGLVFNYAKSSSYQGRSTGPSYNQQWQVAGKWARDNVPLDAVFGHWWDYGYWVQNGFERATMLDGANSIVYWNYLMGRHVLGGKSQEEALKVLKVHNVSHYLIIKDEIGKYTAYSSIGSDKNYDRYSWITTFNIDPKQTQEKRDETIYFYRGSYVFDDDFEYEGLTYPRQQAGIGAILLPIQNIEIKDGNSTKTQQKMAQPTALVVHRGQQKNVPLECIFINDNMIKFEKPGLKGCFRLMSVFDSNGQLANPIGSGLYVSEEGVNSLWTNLFLFNQKNPDFDTSAFSLIYNDDNNYPLAMVNGRMFGPLKVWKINYPEDLEITEEEIDKFSDPTMKYLPDYFFDV